MENAWRATIEDFESDEQNRLWNERTLVAHFFYHLKQNAKVLSGLIEPEFMVEGKSFKPDLCATIEVNSDVKFCVFEFKFYEDEMVIKDEWEKVQQYSGVRFDYGFLMAITYVEVEGVTKEPQTINGYEVAAFIHKGPELRVAPRHYLARLILQRLLGKVPIHTSIYGGVATMLEDYSIVLIFLDNLKCILQLYFRFELGTKEAVDVESKLREIGFAKWERDDGELVETYTKTLLLGEFELEPGVNIFSTSGYRGIRNCLNRVKPILVGLKPALT